MEVIPMLIISKCIPLNSNGHTIKMLLVPELQVQSNLIIKGAHKTKLCLPFINCSSSLSLIPFSCQLSLRVSLMTKST